MEWLITQPQLLSLFPTPAADTLAAARFARLPAVLHSLHLAKESYFLIFFFLKIYLLIDSLLCWVFVSVRGLPVVAASGGHSSSRCAGLSLSRPLLLWSTGSRRAGSAVVAHGPSCSVACGIFLDQGANPCPLHWQADSQPLRHQGSPRILFFNKRKNKGMDSGGAT